MIRLAHLGDDHFDEHSRFEECIRVHDFAADEIARRKVDLTVCSGDLFERKSTIRERNAAAAWLVKMTNVAPLVLVRGNHDAATPDGTDLSIFRHLNTRHPLIVEEAAGVHTLHLERGGVAHVGAVAWPQPATARTALERLGGPLSMGEADAGIGEMLRNVLRGIGQTMDDRAELQPGPRILAMHALVTGCVTSLGQPLIGNALEVGLDDLALARASYTALAHIHKSQSWMINGAPAVYCGSPFRTAYGETEPKGFVVAEFDGSHCVDWELVRTPCAGMILLQDEWGPVVEDGPIGWACGDWVLDDAEFAGAEVRFRYNVPSDQRTAARAAAAEIREKILALGAVAVKLDERVIATTRARAADVAKATTTEDQLAAMWATKRADLDPARRSRLVEKLAQVRG